MSTADTDRRAKRLTRCAYDGCTNTPTGAHIGADWLCSDHAAKHPVSTAAPPRVGESPRALAGVISPRAVVGLDESGKRSPGGESWEYHEHYATPSLHHDEAIVVGGVLRFRQSPTVYSRHAPMLSPKAAATVAREMSEATAQRVARDLLLGGAVADLAGRPASDVREALARELGTVSARQLKRRAKRNGGRR